MGRDARALTKWLAIGVFLGGLGPSVASAQPPQSEPPPKTHHWGVAVAFVPSWRVPTGDGPLAKLAEVSLTAGDLGLSVRAADFRIGVVRGRAGGGEWGVSYVRRTYDEGSTQGGFEQQCFDSGLGESCFEFGELYRYQKVTFNGIEAEKYVSFVTIKNVVQIGFVGGGGVGALGGTAELEEIDSQFDGQMTTQTRTVEPVDPKELLTFSPAVTGRAELAAAVIIPGGGKVRFSGGVNYPGGHSFSVTGMYFIGRR